jgi:TonB family protein
MKIPLIRLSTLPRALHVTGIALLVLSAGCAHAPLRQQTAGIERSPTVDLPPGVNRPVPVRALAPRYPEKLISAGVEGSAWVRCWVDGKGEPHDISAFEATQPEFAEAAVAAVTKWSFAPGTRDGRPLGMWVAIPFNFVPLYPSSGSYRW